MPNIKDSNSIPLSNNMDLSGRNSNLASRGLELAKKVEHGREKESWLLKGHAGGVNSVAFSSYDKYLLSGGDDATIRLWNIETGNIENIFGGHSRAITKVAFMPIKDNDFLSTSMDGTALYWNMKNGTSVCAINTKQLHHENLHIPFVSLAVSTFSRDVLLCPKSPLHIHIWDLITGKFFHMDGRLGGTLFSNPSEDSYEYMAPWGGQDVAFSSMGRLAAACSDKTIFIWDYDSGDIIHFFGGPPTTFFVSPDRVFTIDQNGLYNQLSFKAMEEIGRHRGIITSIDFSPTDEKIISGSEDQSLRIWDIKGSSFSPMILEGHTGAVRDVVYTPNGCHVVSGGDDRTVRVWDVETGNTEYIYKGHSGAVTSIAISFDGELVASGSKDGTIRIWNLLK